MKIESLVVSLLFCQLFAAQPIDRKALVQRHNIVNTKVDSLSSLTVGNGKFAFTVDVTGLQTFCKDYERGVALGTQSEWGWHSFINTKGYKLEDAMKVYQLNGRNVSYTVQSNAPQAAKDATNWFRQNPHRLQLGNLGFELMKTDGTLAKANDIKDIKQKLDLWTGKLESHFTLEGILVSVLTYGHGQVDAVSAHVQSPLIQQGRLKIFLRLPYPTAEWTDYGTNWENDQAHISDIKRSDSQHAEIIHQFDTTKYFINLSSSKGSIAKKQSHYFALSPGTDKNTFEFTCQFTPSKKTVAAPNFLQTKQTSESLWKDYWLSGGAIDFSGSTDPRAKEIESRTVLSQYLMRVQEAGSFPPQETGLTYNSWYGKPHLEMHWWHAVHYALWGRIELLEKSLEWYFKVAPNARKIAQRQGYEGVRWQKMTDHEGEESPSSIGAFLIWQQPHYIYFTELVYRERKNLQTLNKYKDLVFATADFMASFVHYDSLQGRYILGKGLIPAQERYKAEETYNPTYELAYWHWALSIAQKWRERLNLPRNKRWDEVLAKLSPLPVQGGVYLATENAEDSYTNPEYKTDHPSVFGTYGMLPKTPLLDTAVMQRTFDTVWNSWTWSDTWGWDFPMTAMTATRLGRPEKAIDALLMPVRTNTYLVNGHNYQDERLRIYLPGNGGLLTAIAMMVAGYDGATPMPGIPQNKGWKVRWEGLRKMP